MEFVRGVWERASRPVGVALGGIALTLVARQGLINQHEASTLDPLQQAAACAPNLPAPGSETPGPVEMDGENCGPLSDIQEDMQPTDTIVYELDAEGNIIENRVRPSREAVIAEVDERVEDAESAHQHYSDWVGRGANVGKFAFGLFGIVNLGAGVAAGVGRVLRRGGGGGDAGGHGGDHH